MEYTVTVTTALDRTVTQANVQSEKAARVIAELYNESGYTTTIHDANGTLVEKGRPKPPRRVVRKQWEK